MPDVDAEHLDRLRQDLEVALRTVAEIEAKIAAAEATAVAAVRPQAFAGEYRKTTHVEDRS